MKILSSLLLLVVGFSATTASAYGLECTTQSHKIDFMTLDRDGGEETVTVHYLSEKKERFLVLQNRNGSVVAVRDNDLDGGNSSRGVILNYSLQDGRGVLALDGDVIDVTCTNK